MSPEQQEKTVLDLIRGESERCGHRMEIFIHGARDTEVPCLNVTIRYFLNHRLIQRGLFIQFFGWSTMALLLGIILSLPFIPSTPSTRIGLAVILLLGGLAMGAFTSALIRNARQPRTTGEEWAQHIAQFLTQRGYSINRHRSGTSICYR